MSFLVACESFINNKKRTKALENSEVKNNQRTIIQKQIPGEPNKKKIDQSDSGHSHRNMYHRKTVEKILFIFMLPSSIKEIVYFAHAQW